MSVNYAPTGIPGTSRRRAKSILLSNPHNGSRSITFVVEDVVLLADGSEITKDAGSFTRTINMALLSAQIPSIDLSTFQPTGVRSGADILSQIDSMLVDVFLWAAMARDLEFANVNLSTPSEPDPSDPTLFGENKGT